MNWKLKATILHMLSNLPQGESVHYVFQKYLSKTLPSPDAAFLASVDYARRHVDAFQRHHQGALDAATFYEFGAGWEMIAPLTYYALGVERQIVVDIRRLSRPSLVNTTIERYSRIVDEAGLARKPTQSLSTDPEEFSTGLKEIYGIDYRAPTDARRTGFAGGSIDCITSTAVLEHIPPLDIEAILRECHRILRNDGFVSFLIDYVDHYSYSDSRLSGYNYLRYSDAAWKWLNPPFHYQNRLRHADYVKLIETASFEVIDTEFRQPTAEEIDAVKNTRLAPQFRTYSLVDLAVPQGLILARKRPGG